MVTVVMSVNSLLTELSLQNDRRMDKEWTRTLKRSHPCTACTQQKRALPTCRVEFSDYVNPCRNKCWSWPSVYKCLSFLVAACYVYSSVTMTTKLSLSTDECGQELGARSAAAENQCLESYLRKEKQASNRPLIMGCDFNKGTFTDQLLQKNSSCSNFNNLLSFTKWNDFNFIGKDIEEERVELTT